MKIIRESLNFERGGEPKKSMDIGKSKLDRELIENTDWAIDLDKHSFLYEIIELIRDYKGFPILVLKNKQQESWPFRAISLRGIFGLYGPTTEKALEDIKDEIDKTIRFNGGVAESLNFERGLDPFKALGVGIEDHAKRLKEFLEDRLNWNGARVQIINNHTAFIYRCYPGQSVRRYIIEALDDFGDGGKYKVVATDLTSRGDPDGGEWHEYLITPKKTAKRIKESLNFERGLEPKESMGIGLTAIEKRIIEETDWHEDLEGVLQVADIVKVIIDFRGFPIVILKLRPENFAYNQEPFIGISPVDKTSFLETEEIAEHDAKIDIENWYFRKKHY